MALGVNDLQHMYTLIY